MRPSDYFHVTKDKPCTPCQLNAALNLTFDICSTDLKGKIDCKKLARDYDSGKIRKSTLVKQVYAAAEASGKKRTVRDVRQIAKFINVKL